MNYDKYPFVKGLGTYYYEFTSEGPKGKIKKVVRYRLISEIPECVYSLEFGDWDELTEDVNHIIKSNNRDSQKVLATVAETVQDFLRCTPGVIVFAQGSTPSRTRLYQMGITSVWNEINGRYIIAGYVDGKWTDFEHGINYLAFLIKAK